MSVRQKRAAWLLGICLCSIAVMAGLRIVRHWLQDEIPVPYVDRVMGVAVVEDREFLAERERLECSENPGVLYEEILLPFDRSGTLYLPQNVEEGWRGRLSAAPGYYLCAPRDAYWGNMEDAIRENHSFTLWLVGDKEYYELRLVISGLPVISIQTSRSEAPETPDDSVDMDTVDPDIRYCGQETLYYGRIDVFNPGVNTSGYEILQAHLRYHHKGASSYSFEKKGYSLSLQNHKEQNIDVSLLGMRMDNTWKLNAMFNDPNRIREMTASQIWERFDMAETSVNEAGPRMEYVELVLDGSYEGVYCLVEPVDEKKLGLDRNDILYKIFDWLLPEDGEIQESVDMGWKMQYPIRIRYPEAIADYAIAWYPMRDYLNTFYRGWETSYEEMLSRVDIANVADKQMFVMVTSAEDNYFKNTYFGAKVDTPDRYVMYQVPWDLDLTFGSRYDPGERRFRWYDPDYTREYNEKVMSLLLEGNPEEVGEYLKSRWRLYRESFLSTEAILNLMRDNRDRLVETGAALREKERWPEEEVDMDIDYLLDFQAQRMEWLDWYFDELPQ